MAKFLRDHIVIKRSERRVLGIFIDGTGLDRAARRLNRKVDLARLVKGVAGGLTPIVARYYTLIPYEDDSRQRAFLDAVHKAGLSVVVKRLPPKGISKLATVDLEMATDIIAFAMGKDMFSDVNEYHSSNALPTPPSEIAKGYSTGRSNIVFDRISGRTTPSNQETGIINNTNLPEPETTPAASPKLVDSGVKERVHRIITVVCPSRDLAYPISLAREVGAETQSADFGKFGTRDVLKSASNWIDLSDSELIWRE